MFMAALSMPSPASVLRATICVMLCESFGLFLSQNRDCIHPTPAPYTDPVLVLRKTQLFSTIE
jgi:hypothetical protein